MVDDDRTGVLDTLQCPPHVPPHLIRDYDHVSGPEVMRHPPSAIDDLREDARAFYSPRHGGFWVLTRYQDIRAAFHDPELFPQWGKGVPVNPFARTYIPLNLNPPEHHSVRKALIPLLSPRRVRALEDVIRDTARNQIARIAPQGQCEFVTDFALTLPAAMFCGLLGLPVEQFPIFNEMSNDLIYRPAQIQRDEGIEAARAFRADANRSIEEFMRDIVELRKRERADDMISFLLDSSIDGQPMTEDEVFNIATLMFFAGTDSTGSAIAFAFAFLAEHPRQRQRIVDDPSIVGKAADELLRFHGFHHITRQVSRDTEFAGVRMRAGDLVLLPTGGANHDPREFTDPTEVNFDRKATHHLTFGNGIHRCIGAPLATLELRVALEEFHRFVPEYSIAPGQQVEYLSGQSKTIAHCVPLVFDPVEVHE
ncbi:cytochrome P450 [Nocardia sp. NPDC052278]|uniref:cytochrome P450 n=1 Tax=unclassified Nocardia TaxID=2637762 RepID=UPI0036ACCA20